MDKIIYFDYCAVAVFGMLWFSAVFRKMNSGKQGYYFSVLLVVSFLSAVFDTAAIWLDIHSPESRIIKYIMHALYLTFHNATTCVFLNYIVTFLDIWHILRKRKETMALMCIPYGVVIFSLLINPLTHHIFYIDENGTYTRGKFFVVLYIATAIYSFLYFYFLIVYRKGVSFGRWVSFIVALPFMLVSVLYQSLNPDKPIEMIVNACVLLFISMMVQRPEERIDAATGALSIKAWDDDIKRSFVNEKDMKLILVTIQNYFSLVDMLGNVDINILLTKAANCIKDASEKRRKAAEIYYTRRGTFSVVIDNCEYDILCEIAEEVNTRLKRQINIENMDVSCVSDVCVVRCPIDISTYDGLTAFINYNSEKKNLNGEVTEAADIVGMDRYNMMLNMDTIINRALANHNLKVYYQPIWCVEEKRFKCAEALIRLIDDEYGFVPPDLFIPVAEKNGTIHKIGEFVLERVCELIESDKFKELNVDYIDVNISVAQCMNSKLAEMIDSVLDKHKLSHDKVVLEITETAASYSQSIMNENIRKLSEGGYVFSLDDFGTGYSNMQRIADLPLGIAKLDKTFVQSEDNPKFNLVTEGAVNLIKAMDMQIVVEGVETKEMLDRFVSLGCEYIQGYYFSKPLPEDDYISFIRKSMASA